MAAEVLPRILELERHQEGLMPALLRKAGALGLLGPLRLLWGFPRRPPRRGRLAESKRNPVLVWCPRMNWAITSLQPVVGRPSRAAAGLQAGSDPAQDLAFFSALRHSLAMPTYRRRLPHWHLVGQPLFLTWRLHASWPRHRPFPNSSLTSGKAFVARDRLLEECRSGPLPLSRPEIAPVVVEALGYGQDRLRYYTLHAFVVMPHHVDLLLTPYVAVPKLLRTLKAFTARRANRILGWTGKPFWPEES